jgi:hypothetical protein
MPSAAPPLDEGSTADGSDAVSEDSWAKAFRRLTPEDQKQFNHSESGILGVLKGVRIVPPVIKS